MATNYLYLLAVIMFVLMRSTTSSNIFDGVFDSHESIGRTILQAKTKCPIDFESQNYTIFTSTCKGPDYPAKACCDAFLEFACPFADTLNDPHNDCAVVMFSYINLKGNYKPGLFASKCVGDKEGLACPTTPPQGAPTPQPVAPAPRSAASNSVAPTTPPPGSSLALSPTTKKGGSISISLSPFLILISGLAFLFSPMLW